MTIRIVAVWNGGLVRRNLGNNADLAFWQYVRQRNVAPKSLAFLLYFFVNSSKLNCRSRENDAGDPNSIPYRSEQGLI